MQHFRLKHTICFKFLLFSIFRNDKSSNPMKAFLFACLSSLEKSAPCYMQLAIWQFSEKPFTFLENLSKFVNFA